MSPSAPLAVFAVVVLLVGALVSLAIRGPRLAAIWGVTTTLVAAGLGAASSLTVLRSGGSDSWLIAEWPAPMAAVLVGVDPLSAWFALPVCVLAAAVATSAAASWESLAGRKHVGALWFLTQLFLAAMLGVLLARNGVLFLVCWEVMSLAAFALVTVEHERPEVRRAGWIYLVAAHIGLAALLLLFLTLFRWSGGSEDFTALGQAGAPPAALLLLAMVGFGAKAGLAPLHVWLPEAHAAAPSHVSALMSGAMVKLGIYGILRVILVVGAPGWLGPALLVAGLAGSGLGIAQAVVQRDLKRVLAFSTVENVGIVFVGLGAGLLAHAHGSSAIAALGVGGAALHVWVHALAKPLLFLGAGNVVHGAGTRDLEALGGLARRMPWTAALLVIGAVAIAALPPLGGFASEWLIAQCLLRGGLDLPGAAGVGLLIAVGVLAFNGGLAAIAFARLVGVALLGSPRSAGAATAHEAGPAVLVPMAFLGAGCVAAGLAPTALAKLAEPLVAELVGDGSGSVAATLGPLGPAAAAIWLSILALGATLAGLARREPIRSVPTWDCGFAAPTSRMQSTARGFGRLTESTLPAPLRSRVAHLDPPRGTAPGPSRLTVTIEEPVLELAYLRLFAAVADRCVALRRLQRGRVNLYVAYVALVVVVGLAAATFGGSWGYEP